MLLLLEYDATYQRLSAMDYYVVQTTSTVFFKVKSAFLSPEAKQNLDHAAATALTMKGYVLEVTGFASADGYANENSFVPQTRSRCESDFVRNTYIYSSSQTQHALTVVEIFARLPITQLSKDLHNLVVLR